jgi:predicted DNA-binding transcriptional regulator
MYEEFLEQLGFSPIEAKIYECLVDLGESSFGPIVERCEADRRNVGDALNRMKREGLVLQKVSATGTLYSPVEPKVLAEKLEKKYLRQREALAVLEDKFHRPYSPEEAYLFSGLEGQKNTLREILRAGSDSYIIGAKGDWFHSGLDDTRDSFFREANEKQMKFFIIFDYEIMTQAAQFVRDWPGILNCRFLPQEYSTSSLLHIFGEYVIMYSGLSLFDIGEHTTFFVLHSKDLAESYQKWFWFTWKNSIEPTESR